MISLAAGDTWTGETFFPEGNGVFNQVLFASTFNAVSAARKAIYVAGVQFSAMFAILIADGCTSGEATTLATEYCARLGIEDALIAARDAAEAGSQWVTLTRYGAGANPIIAPGGSINFGIAFDKATFHGGWRIDGVDVRNCQASGIWCQKDVQGQATGLIVRNNVVQNCTGMAISPTHMPGVVPGYNWFTATGILAYFVDYVFFDHCVINSTDTPHYIAACNYVVTDAVSMTDSFYLHPYFTSAALNLSVNCVYNRMCSGTGLPTGSAGLIIGFMTYMIVSNAEIEFTVYHGDGVAFDLEVNSTNTFIHSCNFHDNSGSAMLMGSSGAVNVSTMIVDNTFRNNGTQFAGGTFPALVRFDQTIPGDRMVWARNQTFFTSGQSTLWGAGHAGLTNNILTYAPQALYGVDNTAV